MSAEDNIDYSLLTPEEIEAIGAEPSPDELVTMRQAQEAENLDDDPDDIDPEIKDTPPIEGESPKEQPKEIEAKGDELEQSQEQPKQAVQEQSQPEQKKAAYQADLPADFQEQVDAVKADKVALKEAYKNGDIDFDTYESKTAELSERASALEKIALKAEISREMRDQAASEDWGDTQRRFFDESRKTGVDYGADQGLIDDLNVYVKALATNPANNDKSMRWFLDAAHQIVVNTRGLKVTDPVSQPQKPASRRPGAESIPQTLAHVPGATDQAEGESQFAALDKLEGLALETALAKMSPDQRDAYLRGM